MPHVTEDCSHGPRQAQARQQPLFVCTDSLAAGPHPCYESLNKVLDAHHFDTFAEGLCARFYDDGKQGGRPGLPPGVYFRCLLVGYFEGIDSERGIDWTSASAQSSRGATTASRSSSSWGSHSINPPPTTRRSAAPAG